MDLPRELVLLASCSSLALKSLLLLLLMLLSMPGPFCLALCSSGKLARKDMGWLEGLLVVLLAALCWGLALFF